MILNPKSIMPVNGRAFPVWLRYFSFSRSSSSFMNFESFTFTDGGLWQPRRCPRKFPSRFVSKHTADRRSTENESAIPETFRSPTHLYITLKFFIFVEFPTWIFFLPFIFCKLSVFLYVIALAWSSRVLLILWVLTNLFSVFLLIVDLLVSTIFTHRLFGRKINYIVIIDCCHIRSWVQ